ncbi:hypothetical protein N0V90_002719 [Kalmusia sp. IMI 367209]|nr:hypothetical protein N0V90_002719 [Kalmusia sp. IMI 367209]
MAAVVTSTGTVLFEDAGTGRLVAMDEVEKDDKTSVPLDMEVKPEADRAGEALVGEVLDDGSDTVVPLPPIDVLRLVVEAKDNLSELCDADADADVEEPTLETGVLTEPEIETKDDIALDEGIGKAELDPRLALVKLRLELDVDVELVVRLADDVVLENAGGGDGGTRIGLVTVVVVVGVELIHTVDVLVVVTIVEAGLVLEDVVGANDGPLDIVKVVIGPESPPLSVVTRLMWLKEQQMTLLLEYDSKKAVKEFLHPISMRALAKIPVPGELDEGMLGGPDTIDESGTLPECTDDATPEGLSGGMGEGKFEPPLEDTAGCRFEALVESKIDDGFGALPKITEEGTIGSVTEESGVDTLVSVIVCPSDAKLVKVGVTGDLDVVREGVDDELGVIDGIAPDSLGAPEKIGGLGSVVELRPGGMPEDGILGLLLELTDVLGFAPGGSLETKGL